MQASCTGVSENITRLARKKRNRLLRARLLRVEHYACLAIQADVEAEDLRDVGLLADDGNAEVKRQGDGAEHGERDADSRANAAAKAAQGHAVLDGSKITEGDQRNHAVGEQRNLVLDRADG